TMPSSSRNSRRKPASGASPASSLPPGNSQRPGWARSTVRREIRTRPSRSRRMPTMTCRCFMGSEKTPPRAAVASSGSQLAVAMLELAARAAWTGFVPAHLAPFAHEGFRRFPSLLGVTSGGTRVGVLELHLARGRPLAAFLFHARDFFLGAHLHARDDGDGLALDALKHHEEHLEGFALVLLLRVLLRVAAQVDALAQVIHRGEVFLPQRIEALHHHRLLHVAYGGRAGDGFLGRVGFLQRLEDQLAQAFLVQLLVFLELRGDIELQAELLFQLAGEAFDIPLLHQ